MPAQRGSRLFAWIGNETEPPESGRSRYGGGCAKSRRCPSKLTGRIFAALNAMMLDMLAAVARKDYDDRRRRQAQGIAKAKAEGMYRGRPEDVSRNDGIAAMLKAGSSWSAIEKAFGCSRAKIARRSAASRVLKAS